VNYSIGRLQGSLPLAMLALLAHDVYHLIQLLVHLNHFSLHLMCQLHPWIMTINIDKLREQFISCTSFELVLDAIPGAVMLSQS
jgi:hypothetical protein